LAVRDEAALVMAAAGAVLGIAAARTVDAFTLTGSVDTVGGRPVHAMSCLG
jgi:hypothetical protein